VVVQRKKTLMNWLEDLLKEYPELSAAREKLAAIEVKYSDLENENNLLKREVERLHREIAPTVEGAARFAPTFVEASGVLWKNKRGGGYENVPYCPTCKSALADYSGSLLCLKCNWQAPIKSFEAPKVYHDLFGGK